jgi:hypothetical protein
LAHEILLLHGAIHVAHWIVDGQMSLGGRFDAEKTNHRSGALLGVCSGQDKAGGQKQILTQEKQAQAHAIAERVFREQYNSDNPPEVNGDHWVTFSPLEKLIYLRGTQEAVPAAKALIYTQRQRLDDMYMLNEIEMIEINCTKTPGTCASSPEVSYAEFAAALDVFYANKYNRQVPILSAFHWVKLRFTGSPSLVLDIEAGRLRRLFSKDGK